MKKSSSLNIGVIAILLTTHLMGNCSKTPQSFPDSDTKKCFKFTTLLTFPLWGSLIAYLSGAFHDTSHIYICDAQAAQFDNPIYCQRANGQSCFNSVGAHASSHDDGQITLCPVGWKQIDAYEKEQRNLPSWCHEGPYARKQKSRNKKWAENHK